MLNMYFNVANYFKIFQMSEVYLRLLYTVNILRFYNFALCAIHYSTIKNQSDN